jgi:tetratricopeptide (TPR) repeat protein
MYRRLSGPASSKVARVRYQLALLAMNKGDMEEARAELDTAITVYTNAGTEDPIATARCYAALGQITRQPQDFKKALDILEKETETDYPILITTLLEYGKVLAPQNPELARSLLVRADAAAKRLPEKDSMRMGASISRELSAIARVAGDRSESEKRSRNAVSFTEKAYGPYSKEYLEALSNMAIMYDDLGDRVNALKYYQQSVQLLGRHDLKNDAVKDNLLSRYKHFQSNGNALQK